MGSNRNDNLAKQLHTDHHSGAGPSASSHLGADHEAKLAKIAEAYSSEPWWYDVRGFGILTFAYRSTLWTQIGLFGNNMGPVHLEGAIGSGTLFDIILKWHKVRSLWKKAPQSQITGFDYAPSMLGGAIIRFKNRKDIKLELADVTQLPYQDNTFDTINIANAIHCFPDLHQSFKEVHRVLKKGGTYAGNVLLYPKGNGFLDRIANRINAWGMKKGILYSPCRQEEIQKILKDLNFEFVRDDVGGNCYNFIVRKV